MSNPARIQLLGLPELNAFINAPRTEAARTALAHALLHLMDLLSSHITTALPARTGTVTVAGTLDGFEGLAWNIWETPSPEHPQGRHVLNGGLVQHPDGTWGIHT
jgi:hypothetical protein